MSDGLDEQVLTGGNATPVVRRGGAVHRETGPWTPAVHLLLRALRDGGVTGVPEALGFDERGREILSFVPGETLTDAAPRVLWSIHVLRDAARLLRAIHDASAPLAGDRALVWRSNRHEPAEVICHNDFATYNLIVVGDTLSGAIDFDFASPGPRVWDLAYLAYRIVPFAEDSPDAAELDRAHRLDELITAYGGGFEAADVVAAMVRRLHDLREFTLTRRDATGRLDFGEHAAMYERDAARLTDWSPGLPYC
ncbi:aminoglycoside phosphotransferase family protein [Microbacterium sp. SSM24]|uniref:aminoglycoside phosphotransferase family protein n=1 Tax=Microbacterium sp. SSM24 TaxID=2991714 RepID=UPI002226D63F|nr:aminoglycoside phosphotransferase family protein [Microbacterium sp. SSM24]MCW3494462.1 aminoglycoside phosphotransferase family protein [Microbacterium sp. SSM24]